VKWSKEIGFNIKVEKTKAMLIHRSKLRVYERPKLKVEPGPNAIEMVRQYRILGLILDDRLNTPVVKARAGQLKTLAHKKWGGDQKNVTY
jgi:hypothetical protein